MAHRNWFSSCARLLDWSTRTSISCGEGPTLHANKERAVQCRASIGQRTLTEAAKQARSQPRIRLSAELLALNSRPSPHSHTPTLTSHTCRRFWKLRRSPVESVLLQRVIPILRSASASAKSRVSDSPHSSRRSPTVEQCTFTTNPASIRSQPRTSIRARRNAQESIDHLDFDCL